MSLAKFLSLTDASLEAKFNETKPDPTKLRKPIVKKLDTAIKQLEATEPTKGRKMWSLKNGIVRVELPFMIKDENAFTTPSERAADALYALREAVGNGELDQALLEAQEGYTFEEKPKRARKSGSGSGWSPERRAAFNQSIAARKAAKQS